MNVLVLPGMDGGGGLSQAFRAALGASFPAQAVVYPASAPLPYEGLLPLVRAQLERCSGPTTLVAESFSGPLACTIAADPPTKLAAVVLAATFVQTPVPRWLTHLARPSLFGVPPPTAFIRQFMLDKNATSAEVSAVRAAIRATDPAVLASRARAILSVDARNPLRRIALPMLGLTATRDRLVRRGGLALRDVRPDLAVVPIDGPHL